MGELILMPGVNLRPWLSAPRERTKAYYPTYYAVSRALQTALRDWTREWLHSHPKIWFDREQVGRQLLVYISTHPSTIGLPNAFTYDIQSPFMTDKAFRSARLRIRREIEQIPLIAKSSPARNQLFGAHILSEARWSHATLYRMFHADTVLVDLLLKFALIDIPKLGFEKASDRLRRVFRTQLRRTKHVPLEHRSDELLRICTEALTSKMAESMALQTREAS